MQLVRRIALVAVVVASAPGTARAEPAIGSAAPEIRLPDPSGRVVTVAPRDHSVLVIDFFATWCQPCHQALDALTQIASERGASIQLVIVDVRETPEEVNAFFAGRPLPPGTRVLLDTDGAAGRAWGRDRFPTTFLVGTDGVIRHINRGYGPGYPARVRRWIDAMLTP